MRVTRALLPLPRRLCFYYRSFVRLSVGLRNNCSIDFHKILRKGSTWITEEINHYMLVVIRITLYVRLVLGLAGGRVVPRNTEYVLPGV